MAGCRAGSESSWVHTGESRARLLLPVGIRVKLLELAKREVPIEV
jgi:hypothetical protein